HRHPPEPDEPPQARAREVVRALARGEEDRFAQLGRRHPGSIIVSNDLFGQGATCAARDPAHGHIDRLGLCSRPVRPTVQQARAALLVSIFMTMLGTCGVANGVAGASQCAIPASSAIEDVAAPEDAFASAQTALAAEVLWG